MTSSAGNLSAGTGEPSMAELFAAMAARVIDGGVEDGLLTSSFREPPSEAKFKASFIAASAPHYFREPDVHLVANRSRQFNDGRRNAIKACVAWLHAEAETMNDPHARRLLNTAAHGMGAHFARQPAQPQER